MVPTGASGTTVTVFDSGLVAWYQLDGSWNDSSVYLHHATPVGPASHVFTADGAGSEPHQRGRATFDGATASLQLPDLSALFGDGVATVRVAVILSNGGVFLASTSAFSEAGGGFAMSLIPAAVGVCV